MSTANSTQRNTLESSRGQNNHHNSRSFGSGKTKHSSQPRQKVVDKYILSKTIGAGSMGKVKLGLDILTNEWVAVKIINRHENDLGSLELPSYRKVAWKLGMDSIKANIRQPHLDHSPLNLDEPTSASKKISKNNSNFLKLVRSTLDNNVVTQPYLKTDSSAQKNKDFRILREVIISQLVSHPHICELKEVVIEPDRYYLISELIVGKQLLEIIVRKGKLKESLAQHYSRQISSALMYLHKHSIVHRDLKIENIMVNSKNEIKLIDFGLSNLYSFRKLLKTFCGSLYFAAPELLEAKEYYGPEIDCWSFGIVLYVLVCGKVPFDDVSISSLHSRIKLGKFETPSHLSPPCKKLISSLIVVNPLKRATIAHVMISEWINIGQKNLPNCYLPDTKNIQTLVHPSQIDNDIVEIISNYYYYCLFGTNDNNSVDNIKKEISSILNSNWYKGYLKNKFGRFLPQLRHFEEKEYRKKNSYKNESTPNQKPDSLQNSVINTSNTLYPTSTKDSFESSNSLNSLSLDMMSIISSSSDLLSFTPYEESISPAFELSSFMRREKTNSIQDNFDYLVGTDPLLSIYYMIQAKINHYKRDISMGVNLQEIKKVANTNSDKPLPDKPMFEPQTPELVQQTQKTTVQLQPAQHKKQLQTREISPQKTKYQQHYLQYQQQKPKNTLRSSNQSVKRYSINVTKDVKRNIVEKSYINILSGLDDYTSDSIDDTTDNDSSGKSKRKERKMETFVETLKFLDANPNYFTLSSNPQKNKIGLENKKKSKKPTKSQKMNNKTDVVEDKKQKTESIRHSSLYPISKMLSLGLQNADKPARRSFTQPRNMHSLLSSETKQTNTSKTSEEKTETLKNRSGIENVHKASYSQPNSPRFQERYKPSTSPSLPSSKILKGDNTKFRNRGYPIEIEQKTKKTSGIINLKDVNSSGNSYTYKEDKFIGFDTNFEDLELTFDEMIKSPKIRGKQKSKNMSEESLVSLISILKYRPSEKSVVDYENHFNENGKSVELFGNEAQENKMDRTRRMNLDTDQEHDAKRKGANWLGSIFKKGSRV
ncbi:hypothetical protein BB558_004702 [Smittium angustum]|uniref:Protein kinase domain-containing protein n=1 Tax=Smittium angustum TaxID=133377 RepID=A0A2U1J2K9_SMIAN|nr:hypothetical protein BB558_004702 [Smittium angustum]